MIRKLIAAALVSATFAGPAFAQAAPPAPTPGVAVPPPPQARGQFRGRIQGNLTRQQAQAKADFMFGRYDVNHDGTVTRDEAQQAVEQVEAARGDDGDDGGRAQRMLDRMFGDAQSVTLQQFEAQALARFDAQDLNHDGTVSAAERQQLRAQRPQ